ncbi:hypothetical protein L9F63_009591, partial [Diploptera punctata]
MDPMTLLLAGGLFIVTLLFLFRGKSEFQKKVDQLPGPPYYPIVGSGIRFLFLRRRDVFKFAEGTIAEYKTLFRTWNGGKAQVHLNRPEDVEVILRSTDFIEKGHPYKFLQCWLGTGLFTSTGKKWHSHRKMITPTFHFKILDNFVDVFSEHSKVLVKKLSKEVGNQGFNLCPYITQCTLDIVCETAMGMPSRAQDKDSEYANAVKELSEIVIKRLFRPWLHPDFIFKMSNIGRRAAVCLDILHSYVDKVIAEKRALLKTEKNKSQPHEDEEEMGIKKRKAFLDLLLEASDDGKMLTDEELREEVDTFMFEGHDTTSAGICWVLFLLGLHPDVQDRAYEEIENIFKGSDRPTTMKDLSEMKYLERVIKETLRLYPSVPIISRKLNKDVKIGDYEIPAGCSLTMHIYNIHRNAEHYQNPEKFNPDNFLPEKVVNMHPYAYIPFSAGPRNCIGQRFALLEEKTVVSSILRHYKVQSLQTRDEVALVGELVLRPIDGINVTIVPRNGQEFT